MACLYRFCGLPLHSSKLTLLAVRWSPYARSVCQQTFYFSPYAAANALHIIFICHFVQAQAPYKYNTLPREHMAAYNFSAGKACGIFLVTITKKRNLLRTNMNINIVLILFNTNKYQYPYMYLQ